MVLSSTCIKVAIIAQIVMMARVGVPAAAGARGMAAAVLMFSEEIGERSPVAGVDVDNRAHASAKGRIVRLPRDLDLHRDALNDLDPIAAGILCRQQRELSTARRADAFDGAGPDAARIGVD